MTSDIAWLLGFMIAGGNVNRGQFEVSSVNKDLIDKVARIYQELFDDTLNIYITEPKPYEHKGITKKLYLCTKSSQQACYYLNQLGLKFTDELQTNEHTASLYKEIPYLIFKSNKECQYSFIAGFLDGDGYIAKEVKCKITFCSISKKLLSQFQYLLNMHGIITTKPLNSRLLNVNNFFSIKLLNLIKKYLVTDISKYYYESVKNNTDILPIEKYRDILISQKMSYNKKEVLYKVSNSNETIHLFNSGNNKYF